MTMGVEAIEQQARQNNAAGLWNDIWKKEGDESWRGMAMSGVYGRITKLIPEGVKAIDLGGGIGLLAERLRDDRAIDCTVAEHNEQALAECHRKGLKFHGGDLERVAFLEWDHCFAGIDVVIATEVFEHLSKSARDALLVRARNVGKAYISVPNNRLGPDEEPQHTVKFTAVEFKRELHRFFRDVRVEVIDGYLLGICGFPKGFTMSMTMPVRDEEEDIERVLKSFRGVADEIVIGIDPRSKDRTREICEAYCENVFTLEEPEGVGDQKVPNGGVHFSWVRNQCIERCTSDWIFMTEGHESLWTGHDHLLSIGKTPEYIKVLYVLRMAAGQQWGFPWVFRNLPEARFKRSTHNILDFPEDWQVGALKEVKTNHYRSIEKEMARQKQRKVQNRITLMDDWMRNDNENSLYYLGTEWREYNEDRAIQFLTDFITLKRKNGPMRYNTRLILAKMHAQKGRFKEAREILLGCVVDDWTRTDHWIWLGDIAYEQGNYEEALQFYQYGATRLGNPPFTMWWIDLSFYSWVPAQRLAQVFSALGHYEVCLHWTEQVMELLPPDSPEELLEEARQNIVIVKEALNEAG